MTRSQMSASVLLRVVVVMVVVAFECRMTREYHNFSRKKRRYDVGSYSRRQNTGRHRSVHVGQTEVPSTVAEGELRMVQAH